VSFAAVAAAAYQGGGLPDGMTPGLEELGTYEPPALAFSYGVVAALVEVDEQTGQVTVRRLVFGHDCGTQLNPRTVAQQVIGGALQGQGAALTEQLSYDEQGRPQATAFRDYLVPLAGDIPEIDLFHTETPTPFSLTGAKGVGESGVIAAPAAIVNAVQDALGPGAPQLTTLPVLPERVLAALDEISSHRPSVRGTDRAPSVRRAHGLCEPDEGPR
jgi:carbon-monoxide dehydrogenase large subunit